MISAQLGAARSPAPAPPGLLSVQGALRGGEKAEKQQHLWQTCVYTPVHTQAEHNECIHAHKQMYTHTHTHTHCILKYLTSKYK